jgi:hypothetical protein
MATDKGYLFATIFGTFHFIVMRVSDHVTLVIRICVEKAYMISVADRVPCGRLNEIPSTSASSSVYVLSIDTADSEPVYELQDRALVVVVVPSVITEDAAHLCRRWAAAFPDYVDRIHDL